MAIFNIPPAQSASSAIVEYNITLVASDWVISDQTAQITINNANIDTKTAINVLPSLNITEEQLAEYSGLSASLFDGGIIMQAKNRLVNDIPIIIQINETKQG